jgi:hypothetical protein
MSRTQISRTRADFYVIGGTLELNAACYIPRQADEDLYNYITQGKFCYVLTSRQIGKSSLMIRTAMRLRAEGVNVAVLDLTEFGQNVTVEQWYEGLINRIGQEFNLEDDLERFWLEHERIGPLQRWMRALREVVIVRCTGPVVIFIDEIELVRKLPFTTDEFFAGIRELYNRRNKDHDLTRVSFCLIGVATPSDLIRDTRTTPFNIGQRVELNDFTEAEAISLAQGLGQAHDLNTALLGRILYWTGGHPYLTQCLCQAAANDTGINSPASIDRLCETLFLSPGAKEEDSNLTTVRDRILRSNSDIAGLLNIYAKIYDKKQVRDDATNPLVNILRLSGVTKDLGGNLYIRNRIYQTVFDKKWVKTNMPDAERRRQRMSFLRGLMIATGFFTLIFAVILYLAANLRRERNHARDEALRADRNLQQANLKTQEAKDALVEAERQRKNAEDQGRLALEQKKIAEQERASAEKQRAKAELQRTEAEQQRQLATEQKKLAESRLREIEHQRQMVSEQREAVERYKGEAEQQRKLFIQQQEIARQEQERAEKIELDVSTWEIIKDEKNPAVFAMYQQVHPSGRFIREAIKRAGGGSGRAPLLPGFILGQVYDYETSMPIGGAKVIIQDQDSSLVRSVITSENGVYLIPDLPLGSYKVSITCEGYESDLAKDYQIKAGDMNASRPLSNLLRRKQ